MSLNFGDAIVAQLNANANVKKLLIAGTPAVFAGYVPNSVPPTGVWIGFTRITTSRVTGHDGDEGLAHPRYQFNVGSAQLAQAQAMRDILEKEFNGVSLAYVDALLGNYSLTWLLSQSTGPEVWNETLRTWSCSDDFFIWSNTEPT